jgi:hypothetical protein
MSTLELLETYASFSLAAGRARAQAIELKRQTVVRRCNLGWEVLIFSDSTSESLGDEIDENQADDDESSYSEVDEDYEEIAEEIEGDREDFARSDEDGWYYGDESPPNNDGHDSAYGRFSAPRDPHGRTEPTGSGW